MAFDPTPPPAASRTQPGAIGGSALLAYGRIGDRSGPFVKAVVEGTTAAPLDIAASLGVNARWWPAAHAAGHDEARIEYTEPYILLTQQFGTARIALSYSKEIDAGFDTRNGEQEWLATLAIPRRLSDRSLVTPAFYAGDIRARQTGAITYIGPGLTYQTDPELGWRWSYFIGGYLRREQTASPTEPARQGAEVEAEASLIRQLSPGTAFVWVLGYDRIFADRHLDDRGPAWTALAGLRLTF